MRRITPAERRRFDGLLEVILEGLPEQLHELLEEVPLIVEDEPSNKLLLDMDLDPRDNLCGLHWGTPFTERSHEDGWRAPDKLMLFRLPIMREAEYESPDNSGDGERIGPLGRLSKQIRITLLHEIGHHFGLDEEDLARLGYG